MKFKFLMNFYEGILSSLLHVLAVSCAKHPGWQEMGYKHTRFGSKNNINRVAFANLMHGFGKNADNLLFYNGDIGKEICNRFWDIPFVACARTSKCIDSILT